jgi:PsbP
VSGAARPHRLGALAAGVLACLLLGALTGGCGRDTGSPSGGAGDLKRYTDRLFGFSITYPADWKATTDLSTTQTAAGGRAAESVGFFDPVAGRAPDQNVDGVLVGVYQLGEAATPHRMAKIERLLRGALDQLARAMPDFAGSPLEAVTVNGVPGYRVDYTATQGGTPLHRIAYFLFAGDREYQIVGQALQSDWGLEQGPIQRTLDSFQAK